MDFPLFVPHFMIHNSKSGFNICLTSVFNTHCFLRQALGQLANSGPYPSQFLNLKVSQTMEKAHLFSWQICPSGQSDYPWDLPRANHANRVAFSLFSLSYGCNKQLKLAKSAFLARWAPLAFNWSWQHLVPSAFPLTREGRLKLKTAVRELSLS